MKAAGSFELHLRQRRHKLCLCGHDGGAHGVLSCKVCDCKDFRLAAGQPKKFPATLREIQNQEEKTNAAHK